MRRLFVLTLFCLSANISFSQVLTPVSWDFTATDDGNREYTLIFRATIDESWVVYSQYLESDDGPIPTSFTYEDLGDAEIKGENIEEGTIKEEFDKIFEMNLKKLSGEVYFKQKIRGNKGDTIKGYLTYMTCDNARCLPPTDVDFEITLP